MGLLVRVALACYHAPALKPIYVAADAPPISPSIFTRDGFYEVKEVDTWNPSGNLERRSTAARENLIRIRQFLFLVMM